MEYAHSKNKDGRRQPLMEHLQQVAESAATFSKPFQGDACARLVGWLHDIGKYDPAFQQYLLQAEANPKRKQRGPDHKGAGAYWALTNTSPLSHTLPVSLIVGHHGGLLNVTDLKAKIRRWKDSPEIQQAIRTAIRQLPVLTSLPPLLLPAFVQTQSEKEFFFRMVFSALVDADFLDTEQHFQGGTPIQRFSKWSISDLWPLFESAYRQQFAQDVQSRMNTMRQSVYTQSVEAAIQAPGFFRLTVPTGGGKTLASLAFALRHATIHKHRRVIYAIPYTSIIDQTVAVFRKLFKDDEVVLEHHSNVTVEDPEDPTPFEVRRRLVAENWDAPLIVTTTVQLFESLLGRKTGTCRKLHRIAGSILILDEAQMLPTPFLKTILAILSQLVEHYGVTVVFCTATQPSLENRRHFEGIQAEIREIVPHPEQLFARLQHRVIYDLSPLNEEAWKIEYLAEKMTKERQALVILNTRRDAISIFDYLQGEGGTDVFSLSTFQCGFHRRLVIEEIKRRLANKEPCYLVATQVIEAGVDIDFPLVFRTLGPLDRIVQAAGRANRNDGETPGRVIIFNLSEGKIPKGGDYVLGTDITRILLQQKTSNLHDPHLYQKYFQDLYSQVNRDARGIEQMREKLAYEEVSNAFHMIDDNTMPVVISEFEVSKNLLQEIRNQKFPDRRKIRALQPFIVNLPSWMWHQSSTKEEFIPDLWEWKGHYDAKLNGRGIYLDGTIPVNDCLW